jgi:hypothetical protein
MRQLIPIVDRGLVPDTDPMRGMSAAALLMAGCFAPVPPAGAPCPDGVCPRGLVCSPASQTCERIAIDAAHEIPEDAAADAASDAGIDAPASAYLYRRRITIQNAATTALPAGFTIRLTLGTTIATLLAEGKVKADLSDLRVIGDGSLGERDRIVDPATGPAPPAVSFSLVVPIAAGATSTDYALYYGAPAADAAPANGSAVFALYDDFASGISSVWLQNDAPATSSGKLVLRAGRTDALTTNASSDGVPIVSAVELLVTVADPNSDPTTQPEGTFYYWFGYQRTGNFTATDPWILWIARGKNVVRTEQKSPVGCETECAAANLAQNTATHYYAIERDPDRTRFYRDGTLATTTTVTNSTDYSIMVRNYMATSDIQIDWIRARARVTPEPVVTLGAEQAL